MDNNTLETNKEKCCKSNCNIVLFILLILLALFFAGYVLYKEGVIFKKDKAETSCKCKKCESTATKCDVDKKSSDDLYKEYLSNLKKSIQSNYKDYSNNVISYESVEDENTIYTFTITKDLKLLLDSKSKSISEYKISDDVLSMFQIRIGNGGYNYIYFIKADGTLNSLCIDCIDSTSSIKVEKENAKNIVSVIQGAFDYEYSGTEGTILVDIDGNVILDK